MHEFDAGDRRCGLAEILEAEHRSEPKLDGSVILFDPARRHPANPGLLDDGDQRLFRRLARLQERREVAARPQLLDLEIERAKPCVERAVAVAVRMMSSVKPCGSPQSDVWGSLASGQARDAINSYPVGQADPGALRTACKR